MQIKGVSAHRRAPLLEVRHLLKQNTDGNAATAVGQRHVDIDALNRMLDERWPME